MSVTRLWHSSQVDGHELPGAAACTRQDWWQHVYLSKLAGVWCADIRKSLYTTMWILSTVTSQYHSKRPGGTRVHCKDTDRQFYACLHQKCALSSELRGELKKILWTPYWLQQTGDSFTTYIHTTHAAKEHAEVQVCWIQLTLPFGCNSIMYCSNTVLYIHDQDSNTTAFTFTA